MNMIRSKIRKIQLKYPIWTLLAFLICYRLSQTFILKCWNWVIYRAGLHRSLPSYFSASVQLFLRLLIILFLMYLIGNMNILDKTKRLLLPVMLLMLTAVPAIAEDVSFTAQAPQAVVKGDQFRISFKVNAGGGKEFRAPDMKSLSVLSGPSLSTFSSAQTINGKMTSSTTVTYTYVVIAEEEGDIKLDGATIKVDGKQYTSNSLTIKVLPPDQNQAGQGQGSSRSTQQQSSGQGTASAGADDLFMLATVDKTTAYEQEAILLTFKIYAAPSVNLTSMSNKMPDLKNFHVQEVELPTQKEFQLEHYNGRNYQTMVWMQYLLFPQHSGELEIPATPFEGVVAQRVARSSNDVFDMFFNSDRYVETKRDLTTRPIKINVKTLPQGKTKSFYGGVGDFSVSSTISSTDVTANDAVTIRVILSGTGNLKLVKTPEISFPQDFDIYDPKVENKYTIKGGRQTGNKVYEYLVIPRHSGQYTIPAVEFQFFDSFEHEEADHEQGGRRREGRNRCKQR